MHGHDNLKEGIRLFNAQKYFEAHEALEALWLKAAGDRKKFLHGLIQVAAAFHHRTHNNPEGFHSLLEKGSLKLEALGPEFDGMDLANLKSQLRLWRAYVRETSGNEPPPALPRIKFATGTAPSEKEV